MQVQTYISTRVQGPQPGWQTWNCDPPTESLWSPPNAEGETALASPRLASPARVRPCPSANGGSWLVTGRSIDQAGLQETAAQSRGPQRDPLARSGTSSNGMDNSGTAARSSSSCQQNLQFKNGPRCWGGTFEALWFVSVRGSTRVRRRRASPTLNFEGRKVVFGMRLHIQTPLHMVVYQTYIFTSISSSIQPLQIK